MATRFIVGYHLFDLRNFNPPTSPGRIGALQFLSACEFPIGELEPCGGTFELGSGLCEPDFVGDRVDDEQEVALMDDVPILEVYSRKCAADLSAELNLVDRGKLTKEA